MKHLKIYVILVLSLTFFASTFVFATDVFAINSCSAGFRAESNDKIDIDCVDNTIVINENAINQDIFIPTKTSAEWNSFDNNRPTGVEFFYKGPTTNPYYEGDNWWGEDEAIFSNDQFCVLLDTHQDHYIKCLSNGTWTTKETGIYFHSKLISWDYNDDGDEDLCWQTEDGGAGTTPEEDSKLYCKDDGVTHHIIDINHHTTYNNYSDPSCHDYPALPVSSWVDDPSTSTIFLTGTTQACYGDTNSGVHQCSYDNSSQTGSCNVYFNVVTSDSPPYIYLRELVSDGNIFCAILDDDDKTRIKCYNPNALWHTGGVVTIGDIPNNEEIYNEPSDEEQYFQDNTAIIWNNKLCVGTDEGSVYCGEYNSTTTPTNWITNSWPDFTSYDGAITSLVQWDGRLYAGTEGAAVYYYRPQTHDWNKFFDGGSANGPMTLAVDENTDQMCSIARFAGTYDNPALCLSK